MPFFSSRSGYGRPDIEITVREDAPESLRQTLPEIAYGTGLDAYGLHAVVCQALRRRGNPNINWIPEYEKDILVLLNGCPWFKVYDAIENIYKASQEQEAFTDEINAFFTTNGIGWKLENGLIVFRGGNAFEAELREAGSVLADAGLQTSASELRKAVDDLSRRPDADITGAVQHSMACLECTAREVSGGTSDTLGALIRRRRDLVPPQLDTVVSKIFGFASDQGRHLQEGKEPSFEEAELLVGLAAALSTYIGRVFKSATGTSALVSDADNDLPF